MELQYFWFLVFFLPSKQKTSPADPTTSTLWHKRYHAKRQSVIYTHTGSHRHSLPRSHGMKTSARGPNTPQHLSNAKKNKHVKLSIDGTMDIFITKKGLITLLEFCKPNGKAKHGCSYCHKPHNSRAFTNNLKKKIPCLFTETGQFLIPLSEHLLPKEEKLQQSSITPINPASSTTPPPIPLPHEFITCSCLRFFFV